VAEFLHLARFEIQRIVADQKRRVRTALDFQGAAYVDKGAAAGSDVVMGFVAFKMFVLMIVLHVAAGVGFVGLIVVLNMIGAKALSAKTEVDVVVGDEEAPFTTLWSSGGEFRDATFRRRGWRLLPGPELAGRNE